MKRKLIEEAESEIRRCGFEPKYLANGHDFSGFRGEVRGWRSDYDIYHRMSMDEFKFGMMLAKACLDVTMGGISPDQVQPCNDGFAIAAQDWREPAFKDDSRLDESLEQEGRCARVLFDRWSEKMNMRDFARALAKGREAYGRSVDEKWRQDEKERREREEEERQARAPQEPRERPEPGQGPGRVPPRAPGHCGFSGDGAYCD